MKTRARKPPTSTTPKPKPSADNAPKPSLHPLAPSVQHPPQLFVLPRNASPNARIITLPNPATSQPCRYFADPEHGFYEFTCIGPAAKGKGGGRRSWLIAGERGWSTAQTGEGEAVDEGGGGDESGCENENEGYILQSPALFLATPIDPLFLMLPCLYPCEDEAGRAAWGTLHDRLFMSSSPSPNAAADDDDADEEAAPPFAHLQTLLKSPPDSALEKLLEQRMRAVCNVVDTGPGEDDSYALHIPLLAEELLGKARQMVAVGLPPSVEERFVRRALEVPEACVRRGEEESGGGGSGVVRGGGDAEGCAQGSVAAAGMERADTVQPDPTTAAIAPTALPDTTAPPTPATAAHLTHLLRLRTALTFLLHTYTPPPLRQHLLTIYTTPTSTSPPTTQTTDFTPLTTHLTHLTNLRSTALALRTLTDNTSRKRALLAADDDEAATRHEAKKRKREEDAKREKGRSQGVKRLGKVDVSGMKKMGAFFGKAAKGC
ncbi:hypothetical protein LTR08_005506 [Meristemomyces frigidus]|nr:hypothetical protein LTR08_005506 [Meristemomyces frigidus]